MEMEFSPEKPSILNLQLLSFAPSLQLKYLLHLKRQGKIMGIEHQFFLDSGFRSKDKSRRNFHHGNNYYYIEPTLQSHYYIYLVKKQLSKLQWAAMSRLTELFLLWNLCYSWDEKMEMGFASYHNQAQQMHKIFHCTLKSFAGESPLQLQSGWWGNSPWGFVLVVYGFMRCNSSYSCTTHMEFLQREAWSSIFRDRRIMSCCNFWHCLGDALLREISAILNTF